jgi:ABC-type antimicrobial peptide transport system permease subunit
MGVRIALGARPVTILTKVLGEGLQLTALGIVIGIGAALLLTRYLESLLYTVRPDDPTVFVWTISILLAVAVIACYAPARRAARVDPIVILREE